MGRRIETTTGHIARHAGRDGSPNTLTVVVGSSKVLMFLVPSSTMTTMNGGDNVVVSLKRLKSPGLDLVRDPETAPWHVVSGVVRVVDGSGVDDQETDAASVEGHGGVPAGVTGTTSGKGHAGETDKLRPGDAAHSFGHVEGPGFTPAAEDGGSPSSGSSSTNTRAPAGGLPPPAGNSRRGNGSCVAQGGGKGGSRCASKDNQGNQSGP